jgi:putative permease
LWKQGVHLLAELPTFVQSSKETLMKFIAQHQDYVSQEYIDSVINNVMGELQTWGKDSVAATLSAIPNVITWVIYLILVPLMAFFFLQDHRKIVAWLKGFLPAEHGIVRRSMARNAYTNGQLYSRQESLKFSSVALQHI